MNHEHRLAHLRHVRGVHVEVGGVELVGAIGGEGRDHALHDDGRCLGMSEVELRHLYRDAAVILIDQLKDIFIDGQLETIDTTQWYPRITRKDFTVGLNVSESVVDDPDQQFYENYVCMAERNYTGYCNPEVDRLVDQQSAESSIEKRKQLVWQIERRLAEDGARPVIFYPRQATCRHPQVKGMTTMVNSIYNGFRYEDLWLDN